MTAVETIGVALGERRYDILIGPGLIGRAGELIAAHVPARRLAIVTDETVAPLYLDPVTRSLSEAGISSVPVIVAPGEASKSFAALQAVTDRLLDARLERGDAVIALGGGVVGDLAGFAAAVTRRGMDLVQMPTTLLAQVDSAVGGKTGINVSQGKNLVGAFHQPRLVLADTDTLSSLPARQFAAGYAELAKSALIDDAGFFAWLEAERTAVYSGGPARMRAIARACAAKARIVAADERETGPRALLNLGHTFAHALEAWCSYDPARLIHGEAVAVGIVLAHRFSAELGVAPAADTARVVAHFRDAGLPTAIDAIPGETPDAAALMAIMAQDKKVRRGRLTLILTHGIGKAYIADDVVPDRVAEFLEGATALQPA